jgi:hypothetical protein
VRERVVRRDRVARVEGEVELVGIAVGAEGLGEDAQAEDVDVEAFGALVVGADDGDVVEEEGHGGKRLGTLDSVRFIRRRMRRLLVMDFKARSAARSKPWA